MINLQDKSALISKLDMINAGTMNIEGNSKKWAFTWVADEKAFTVVQTFFSCKDYLVNWFRETYIKNKTNIFAQNPILFCHSLHKKMNWNVKNTLNFINYFEKYHLKIKDDELTKIDFIEEIGRPHCFFVFPKVLLSNPNLLSVYLNIIKYSLFVSYEEVSKYSIFNFVKLVDKNINERWIGDYDDIQQWTHLKLYLTLINKIGANKLFYTDAVMANLSNRWYLSSCFQYGQCGCVEIMRNIYANNLEVYPLKYLINSELIKENYA